MYIARKVSCGIGPFYHYKYEIVEHRLLLMFEASAGHYVVVDLLQLVIVARRI